MAKKLTRKQKSKLNKAKFAASKRGGSSKSHKAKVAPSKRARKTAPSRKGWKVGFFQHAGYWGADLSKGYQFYELGPYDTKGGAQAGVERKLALLR